MICKYQEQRSRAAAPIPRFFTAEHTDPFWSRQAELLEPVWHAGKYGPDLGISWDRGRVTGESGWRELLPGFAEPIPCDPEYPDDELRGLLGERLAELRQTCEDLRFGHFTCTQIRTSFLISVLGETEVRV